MKNRSRLQITVELALIAALFLGVGYFRKDLLKFSCRYVPAACLISATLYSESEDDSLRLYRSACEGKGWGRNEGCDNIKDFYLKKIEESDSVELKRDLNNEAFRYFEIGCSIPGNDDVCLVKDFFKKNSEKIVYNSQKTMLK
jgi:hypothetical protein